MHPNIQPFISRLNGPPTRSMTQKTRILSYIDLKGELPTPPDLQDMVPDLEPSFRDRPNIRSIFEAMTVANTADTEPSAPPITLSNPIDKQQCPPLVFYYTNNIYCGEGIEKTKVQDLEGCLCRGKCQPEDQNCFCARRQEEAVRSFDGYEDHQGFLYTTNGRIREHGLPIFECNALCRCSTQCTNRVSRHYFLEHSP